MSTRPRSAASLPDSTTSTGLLCLLVGACVHHGRSDIEVDRVATTARASHSVRDIYMWHCTEHPALWVPDPVLWVYHCHVTLVFLQPFWAILGGHVSDAARPTHIILFANVTLLNDTVTSQCHMYIGHVTIYYKRAANALVWGSCLLRVATATRVSFSVRDNSWHP